MYGMRNLDEALQQLSDNCEKLLSEHNKKDYNEIQGHLFHYTTLEGLEGILATNHSHKH